MKIKRNDDTGEWSVTCDGTREELLEVSSQICAMAHEQVGNKRGGKKFLLRFNNILMETSTNVELWMFGKGLELAAKTYVAELFDKDIVKKIKQNGS